MRIRVDKLLVSAYLVWSLVRVMMLWDGFKCEKPIQVWLLVHQLLSLLLFVGHHLAHHFFADPGWPAYSRDRYGRIPTLLPVHGCRKQKVISYSLLFLVVPAFVASDSFGLYVFSDYSDDSPCWPPDIVNQPQVVQLVLVVGCFFGLTFAIFAMSALCNLLRPGRRAAMIASAGMDHPFPRPAVNGCTGPMLSVPVQTLLDHCPEAQCDKDAKVACSICQDDCSDGQPIRTVVVCGHQYHSACLESWLRNRPTCPNCNQDVTTSVV